MKRRALKLLLFLLAGAIINVAVAWGCATWGTIGRIRFETSSRVAALEINARCGTNLPEQVPYFGWYSGVGRNRVSYCSSLQPWFATEEITIDTVGLPLRALTGELAICNDLALDGAISVPFAGELGGPGPIASTTRFLPFNPIWPGFAINTIFYAAIVWFLFFAPGAVRRRVRRKRGQCTTCGYSLRGREKISDTCPECGT